MGYRFAETVRWIDGRVEALPVTHKRKVYRLTHAGPLPVFMDTHEAAMAEVRRLVDAGQGPVVMQAFEMDAAELRAIPDPLWLR